MKMGDYFDLVYEIVKTIPPGQVATYGQLAYLAGFPQAPRIAGLAMARAPKNLPAHRVVNGAGRTAPGFAAQKALLLKEGVGFKKNGCVDLRRYLFFPYQA